MLIMINLLQFLYPEKNYMANNFDKKLALLYLKEYLEHESDENNPITMADILGMLAPHGIESDRRTVYSDLKILKDGYGMDLISPGHGLYCVASRDFELEEIKILVDMVQSSNFLTERKTQQLLEKLEHQVSIYEAKNLKRRIFVRRRVKARNEYVFVNVDKISSAISRDVKVSFRYSHYNKYKVKEYSNGGGLYEISPFALIYVDQNYYMLGYHEDSGELRHYRIDRMTSISVTDKKRTGHDVFDEADISTYTKKTFYMFTGEEKRVTLKCRDYVSDAIIDRFGEGTMIIPGSGDFFTVTEDIVVSPQFFAWISAFGKDIEIVSPPDVRQQYKDHLESILRQCEDLS